MKHATHLALFDLDHTLLPFDSDYQWADFLARSGRAGDPQAAQARNQELMLRYNQGTLSAQESADFMLGLLRLGSPTELASWQQEYMQQVVLPGILPQAHNLIQKHQHSGHLCAIVTATNSFVTQPIAQALGIEHLIATEPERDASGNYTGRISGIASFQEGKIERVKLWLQDYSRRLEDFAESWFYSDSLNDLPLLEVVSHPVATNPSADLRALADKRGWRILDLFTQLDDAKS